VEVFYGPMTRQALALALAAALSAAACLSAATAAQACTGGASTAVAAANGAGVILVSWQDRPVGLEACGRAVASAEIGSTPSGFSALGAISAGHLSFPTAAFLDDAGDGWVVGVHQHLTSSKYGDEYDTSGAWFAFRPAGGRFRHPVELPAGGPPDSPRVAGDPAGRAVLAWSSMGGTYLAWGAPNGRISRPAFYGRFHFTGVGVDEGGRALIAGYYPDPRFGGRAMEIAVISGSATSFSRPGVIAVRPYDARRRVLGLLGQPVMATGLHGQAVIAWASLPDPNSGISRDMMVYRRADGHFNKPVRFATDFVTNSLPLAEPNTAVVDGAGRALIVSGNRLGLEEVAVTPSGRPGTQRRIVQGEVGLPGLAGNPLGETVATWGESRNGGSISFIIGNTQGPQAAPQRFANPPGSRDGPPFAVFDGQANATLIWEHEREGTPGTLEARATAPGAGSITIAGSTAVP
jgi:hypothetical protein